MRMLGWLRRRGQEARARGGDGHPDPDRFRSRSNQGSQDCARWAPAGALEYGTLNRNPLPGEG